MLEQTDVVIGDDEIKIESLPATRALQVLTKTAKIVGGVGHGMQDFPSSLRELKEKGIEEYLHLGKMMEGLLDRLDDGELPKFIKGLIEESLPAYRDRPKKGEGSFDYWYENRFSRDPRGLFALLTEIYRWNYGETFEWLSDFFSKAQEPKQDPAPGLKEPSSQSSGETSGGPPPQT